MPKNYITLAHSELSKHKILTTDDLSEEEQVSSLVERTLAVPVGWVHFAGLVARTSHAHTRRWALLTKAVLAQMVRRVGELAQRTIWGPRRLVHGRRECAARRSRNRSERGKRRARNHDRLAARGRIRYRREQRPSEHIKAK
jgi:hypothetical protein